MSETRVHSNLGTAGSRAIWLNALVVALVSCGSSGSTTPNGPSGGTGAGESGTGSVSSSGASGASASGSVAGSGQGAAAGNTSGGIANTAGSGGTGLSGGSGGTDDAGTSGTSTNNGGGSAGSIGASEGGTGESAGTGAASGKGGAFSGPSYPYIFSNFNDAATLSSLMIYTSNDALNWTLLYDTKFTGPTGFMRDPSIMRHTDGKYYVAFTTPPTLSCCGDESSFAIASSADLKDWSTVATVPSGVAGVKNTWAPEWFIDSDGTVHVTVTLDLKTYRYEPTNSTLTKWGSGTFIGLNGTIDTQIIKIGTTYHAIIPNRHGTSSSLDGPWTFGSDYKAPPNCKEAPAVVHISGDTWRFYCDDGGNGHEKSSLTTDLFQTWSSLQTLPMVGDNISHGTVIRGDTGHPF
jgi:hypothetical protein